MERGLLWLPLLGIFIWLAGSGWHEYRKVEAYQDWAKGFQKSKYDIFAVLGLNGREITWGKPTRRGPVDLATLSLDDVRSIWLLIDHKSVDLEMDLEDLPTRSGEIELEFQLKNEGISVRIPFTEIQMAAQWARFLEGEFQNELQGRPQNELLNPDVTRDSSAST